MIDTGHELKDLGHSLSWNALRSFILNISPESALAREVNPDSYIWSSRAKTNAILADIYDVLSTINSNLCAYGSHRRPKKPKPYPRPGNKDNGKEVTHIGKGALPPDELREWFKVREIKGGEIDG